MPILVISTNQLMVVIILNWSPPPFLSNLVTIVFYPSLKWDNVVSSLGFDDVSFELPGAPFKCTASLFGECEKCDIVFLLSLFTNKIRLQKISVDQSLVCNLQTLYFPRYVECYGCRFEATPTKNLKRKFFNRNKNVARKTFFFCFQTSSVPRFKNWKRKIWILLLPEPCVTGGRYERTCRIMRVTLLKDYSVVLVRLSTSVATLLEYVMVSVWRTFLVEVDYAAFCVRDMSRLKPHVDENRKTAAYRWRWDSERFQKRLFLDDWPN